MTLKPELIGKLLKEYKNPEDLIGKHLKYEYVY